MEFKVDRLQMIIVLLNSLNTKILSPKYERKKRANSSEIEKKLDEYAIDVV